MQDSQHQVLLERVAELEELVSKLMKRISTLERDNLRLHRENEELRARLRAYENAHTPPSLSKKKRPPREPSGRLGAPRGHPKYERQQPEPARTVKHEQETCPHCRSKLKKPFKIERRVIEEIPEPQPIEVTEHLIYHYQCSHCNREVTPEHNLPKGSFGPNLETHVVLLRYADRLPLRKVSESLERQHNVSITNPGILRITNRSSKQLHKEYWKHVLLLRGSRAVYIDETEIKVSRKTYWIWVFVGEQQTIIVIRKSRSKRVLQEILGEHFQGTICCDGWSAYKQYSSNLQRCWAHALRESHELHEKYDSFTTFHNNLKQMYTMIQRTRGKPPPPKQRQTLRKKLEQRMKHMIDAMDSHKHFAKFATKLRNGLPHWFTCITNLLVEPTNNKAERALRELIVQRKIMGCLRRPKGAQIMETIHTMLATWKQQNKPIFPTMRELISC